MDIILVLKQRPGSIDYILGKFRSHKEDQRPFTKNFKIIFDILKISKAIMVTSGWVTAFETEF